MTIHEAIAEIRKTGTVQVENGKLKLRFPQPERGHLGPAIEVLRRDREAVLLALAAPEGDSTKPRCTSTHKSALAEPSQGQVDAAGKLLAKAGVRLIGGGHDVDYIGVWSDLDSAELRAAIAVFHPHGVPVRYLDGDVPMRYKLRRVAGEPVPANVLAAMEQEPAEPWKVRDKMLEAMNWTPDGVPWGAVSGGAVEPAICRAGCE